jgi:hypothetical protein
MRFCDVVKCFLLIFIVIFSTCSGGAVLYHPYDPVPSFEPVYIGWTVINLDPSFDHDQLAAMLYRYGIGGVTVVDGYWNESEYCEDVLLQDPAPFNKDATILIPMGRENYTITIIHERDTPVRNRVGNYLGANLGLRSYVLHLKKDTEADLAIRILHEINHGKNLDSDGMYTTSQAEFNQWCYDVDYQFKDYYTVKDRVYQNTLGAYRIGRGQQVHLDYLLWLFYMNNNTY